MAYSFAVLCFVLLLFAFSPYLYVCMFFSGLAEVTTSDIKEAVRATELVYITLTGVHDEDQRTKIYRR